MRARLAALVAGVVALDQLTKLAVVRSIPEGDSVSVIGDFLALSHIRNSGAAFGLLRGFTGVIALAAIGGLVFFLFVIMRTPSPMQGWAAASVAGGATGNLVDRIFRGPPLRGSVVDFIDFGFWPAFNVADSAITIGALLLVLVGVRSDADRSS